jgi:hypothetical protein
MPQTSSPKIICLACSVLKREIELLYEKGEINVEPFFLDSTLHVKPEVLHQQMVESLDHYLSTGVRIILVYGDCHAYMIDLEQNDRIIRTPGINCCEILLGHDEYRKLRTERAFLIMPEWAHRWKDVFHQTLGVSNKLLPDLMSNLHSKLIYLDTGIIEVPQDCLTEFAEACGLSWHTVKVDLGCLRQSINDAYSRLLGMV